MLALQYQCDCISDMMCAGLMCIIVPLQKIVKLPILCFKRVMRQTFGGTVDLIGGFGCKPTAQPHHPPARSPTHSIPAMRQAR